MFVTGGAQVSDAGDQATLGLKVTNFGPIVEADIELRPLTVFVGPSNTGKSYLAILIYALHIVFAANGDPFRRMVLHGLDRPRTGRAPAAELSDEDLHQLFEWLERIPEVADSDTATSLSRDPLPDGIAGLVRAELEHTDDVSDSIRAQLARCFGVGSDVSQLVRDRSRGGARLTMHACKTSGDASGSPYEYEFSLKRTGSGTHDFRAIISPTAAMSVGEAITASAWAFFSALRSTQFLRGVDADEAQGRQRTARQVIAALAQFVMSDFTGPLSRDAYYLPADRTGVMHAHRAVVSAVIDRASTAGIFHAPEVPTLSGVMGDFLRELIQIGQSDEPISAHGDELAATLERDVLNGAVAVERSDANYPSFVYRQHGSTRVLPMMNTSSMVSELAPVTLYLRHQVDPGDTLIIEEPESHLHPAMQAEFTLHLARLVRAGIRIIVTTHSEWVLDQVANLVRMSDLNDDERDGLRGADAVLTREQVGIWLFQPKPKRRGSVVKEIPIDPDVGGLLSGYDDAAEQLYNTWAEIGNRIADRRAT